MPSIVKAYLHDNLVSLSIALNTLTGGYPYQPFSARNWEWKRDDRLNIVWFIDYILWNDPDHCMECWIRWRLAKHTADQYDVKRKELHNDTLRRRQINPS